MEDEKHFDEELDDLLKKIKALRKQAEDNLRLSPAKNQSAGKSK